MHVACTGKHLPNMVPRATPPSPPSSLMLHSDMWEGQAGTQNCRVIPSVYLQSVLATKKSM